MLYAMSLVACLWFGCPDPGVEIDPPDTFPDPPPIILFLAERMGVTPEELLTVQEDVYLKFQDQGEGHGHSTTAIASEAPPPAPPPPPSTNRGMGSNVEQWRGLVEVYFPGEVEMALCVMAHESGGNPDAKNPTSSATGLMQILASLWAPYFGISASDLYNPETNLSIAKQIRDSQGWGAWSPVKRGAC